MIIVSFGIMYFGFFFFFFLTTKFSLFNRGRGTQVTCALPLLGFYGIYFNVVRHHDL